MKCYLDIYKIEPVFETVFIWLKKIVAHCEIRLIVVRI